jgi:hypothetical protein
LIRQLPKFNLLENTYRQLAHRIRAVYARNKDRIVSELAAIDTSSLGSLERRARLQEAHQTSTRLASETVEQTAAWLKARFAEAEHRRARVASKL